MIVCDLMMDDLRGDEFIRWLKEHKKWRLVPVIVVTQLDNPLVRVDLLDSGADAVLAKSAARRELRAYVAAVLRTRSIYVQHCNMDSGRHVRGIAENRGAAEPARESRRTLAGELVMSNPHERDTLRIWSAGAGARRVDSDWRQPGLAEDLIERFLDATTVRQGFDRARCASQREELRSFHWWMERRHGRAITDASAADLQCYVDELQGRELARKRAKVAAVLREFFWYLREVGIRFDEPV